MFDLLFAATDPAHTDASILKLLLPWITAFVTAVIGAVGILVVRVTSKRQGVEEGKAQAMTIANQPLSVILEKTLEERFVLRRDFERLEASVDRNMTEMKGLFAQTMQAIEAQGKTTERRIDNQNKRLTVVIESVAKSANDGRGKLWKVVNATSNELAAVQVQTDVAEQLGKLSDAVMAAVALNTTTKQPS